LELPLFRSESTPHADRRLYNERIHSSDCAGDVWESFRTEGSDEPLWQCQIKHDVARNVCYQFKEKFAEFCRVTSGVPDTLAELQERGIRLLIGDKNDPVPALVCPALLLFFCSECATRIIFTLCRASQDDCGYQAWRVCFYVAGSLYNFLYLLDAFWIHIDEQMAKETKLEINYSPASNVIIDNSCWDKLAYENSTLQEPTDEGLCMECFQVAPVFGKRPTTVSVEVQDEKTVSLVFSQVYIFRERFEVLGVPGGRVGASENAKGDYVRIMKDQDVSDSAVLDRISQVIEKVLKNLAVRVLVDGKCEADTPVAIFLASLRKRPNMHFADERSAA